MSDTKRRNNPDSIRYTSLSYWIEYDVKFPHRIKKEQRQRMTRDARLTDKGADGHNAKGRSYWRFMSAREDGSGKLNTFDEVGAGRRSNRAKKRQTSKDTRRFGKQIIRKELEL